MRGIALDALERPVEPAAHPFSIPVDSGRRISLVESDLAPHLGVPDSLVWFSAWGVWPSCERPHIFARLRASYGEMRSLSDAPAQVFESHESEDLVSFVTLGVLFLWDVHVVIPGRLSIFYSHDEVGSRSA